MKNVQLCKQGIGSFIPISNTYTIIVPKAITIRAIQVQPYVHPCMCIMRVHVHPASTNPLFSFSTLWQQQRGARLVRPFEDILTFKITKNEAHFPRA